MNASEMTIEEAIRHAEEVAQRKCDECGNQHQQLANWLKELVALRSKLKVAEDALRQAAEDKERLEAVEKIAELRYYNWFSCRNCAREFLRAARGKGDVK